jgi:uroporphyrinogen decarboxylase
MVSSTQLVQAALERRAVDRVPVFTWCHFGPEAAAGDFWLDAHLDWLAASRTDVLKAMNDAGYPLTPTSDVSKPSDWRRLRATPVSHPLLHAYLDDLARLLDRVGESVPVIVTLFDPFCTAADNRGGPQASVEEDFARMRADLRADAAAVSAGLAAVAEGLAAFAAACVARGAAGIFLATHATDPSLVAPALYDEFVLPHVATVIAGSRAAGSWCDIVHVCGDAVRLGVVKSLPSPAVSWAAGGANCSLAEGQRQLGRCAVGGLSTTALSADGSLEQAMAEATAAIAETSGVGLLLAPGCAVPEHPGTTAARRAFEAAAGLGRTGA